MTSAERQALHEATCDPDPRKRARARLALAQEDIRQAEQRIAGLPASLSTPLHVAVEAKRLAEQRIEDARLVLAATENQA